MKKFCQRCGNPFCPTSLSNDVCSNCSIHHPLIVGSGPLDEIDWQQRAISAEIKVRSLEKHSNDKEFTIHHRDGTTEIVIAPVYRDEVGDLCLTAEAIYKIDFHKAKRQLEILKSENTELKQSLESSRAEYEKLKPFLTHHFECPTNSAHTVGQKPFLCTCGLDTLLSTLTKEETTLKCKQCGGEGHYSDQSSNGENTICDCQETKEEKK